MMMFMLDEIWCTNRKDCPNPQLSAEAHAPPYVRRLDRIPSPTQPDFPALQPQTPSLPLTKHQAACTSENRLSDRRNVPQIDLGGRR